MYHLEKRFLTQGTVILSKCFILALTYTNSKVEEKYFVYATISDNDAVQNLDEDEVLLKPIGGNAQELEDVIFGYGVGGVTDIRIGPYDGYIYVLSLDRGGDECKPQYPDRSCIPYSSTIEGHIFRFLLQYKRNMIC